MVHSRSLRDFCLFLFCMHANSRICVMIVDKPKSQELLAQFCVRLSLQKGRRLAWPLFVMLHSMINTSLLFWPFLLPPRLSQIQPSHACMPIKQGQSDPSGYGKMGIKAKTREEGQIKKVRTCTLQEKKCAAGLQDIFREYLAFFRLRRCRESGLYCDSAT